VSRKQPVVACRFKRDMANQRATVRPRSRWLHIGLGISLFSTGDHPGGPKPPLAAGRARPRGTVGTAAPCCQLPRRLGGTVGPYCPPAPANRPAALVTQHRSAPSEPRCAHSPLRGSALAFLLTARAALSPRGRASRASRMPGGRPPLIHALSELESALGRCPKQGLYWYGR
jgi:hypothetical protein